MSMTDAEKIAVLKASILNIGRLIPDGMAITFYRDPGETATMEQVFPNGEMTTAMFTGYSPIYSVPVVPAEYGVTEDDER
jgi:hypothetical protein